MSDLAPYGAETEGGGRRRILLFVVFGLAGVLLLGALALLGFVLVMTFLSPGAPTNTPTPPVTNTAVVVVITPAATATVPAPTATRPASDVTPTKPPSDVTPTSSTSGATPTATKPSASTPAAPTATPKGGVPDTGVGDVALLLGAGLGLVMLLLVLRAVRTRSRPGAL